MSAAKPYQYHLKKSGDLVTTYEATRAGFVALALERNRRATPFVAEARALKVRLPLKPDVILVEDLLAFRLDDFNHMFN